jgi:hypothetical protein
LKIIIAICFVLAQFPVSLFAVETDRCVGESQKEDICLEAKTIAGEIAKQLPLIMSDNMIWESVLAIENTIQGHLRLSYDKESLEKALAESGSDIETAKSAMYYAAQAVCTEGSPTRSFIDMGGAMRYIYEFVDGEEFLTVNVDQCEQS